MTRLSGSFARITSEIGAENPHHRNIQISDIIRPRSDCLKSVFPVRIRAVDYCDSKHVEIRRKWSWSSSPQVQNNLKGLDR